MKAQEIIEKIRAEIERRIETYKKGYANGDDRRADALELLLSFISDLESEKPMNQDGLEEEIERWCYENVDESGFYNMVDYARHFAKWGSEHAKK